MITRSSPSLLGSAFRQESTFPTTANDDTEEIHEIEKACSNGDLENLHALYSTWLARQQPDSSTGEISKDQLYLAAHKAATTNQSTSLAYLLSQGLKLNRELIKSAVLSGSTQVLQILLDHGWNINEPEAYCEPPFLGYVLACLDSW